MIEQQATHKAAIHGIGSIAEQRSTLIWNDRCCLHQARAQLQLRRLRVRCRTEEEEEGEREEGMLHAARSPLPGHGHQMLQPIVSVVLETLQVPAIALGGASQAVGA